MGFLCLSGSKLYRRTLTGARGAQMDTPCKSRTARTMQATDASGLLHGPLKFFLS